jgi:hypothetical protein
MNLLFATINLSSVCQDLLIFARYGKDKEAAMNFRPILLVGLAIVLAVPLPRSAFSAGKATKGSPQTSSPQALADFGVSGIEVQTVKTVDTNKLNAEVSKAASKGENWTKDAVLVALKFVGAGLNGHTKIIDIRTPAEQRDTATVTVTESGYLDDAINGERWRLWLVKGSDCTWTIQRALWARLCDRPGRRFYSAEKCP